MKWRFAEIGWRLLPGGIATIVAATVLRFGGLQPFESVAGDAIFRVRGDTRWDDRLVLVKIDDPSLKALGRFPWSRQRYAQLIDRLSQANASVIAIDLVFSESSLDDAAFADAMHRSNRVVLAQAEDLNGDPLPPVPDLKSSAIGVGHIRTVADSDSIVRRIEPKNNGAVAFGIATVQAYSLTREVIKLPDLNHPIWLNWAGRVQNLQQYSFADVLAGKVNDSAFRNKIVLVGVTASATDAAPTPFDRNPPAHGVDLQATLIHNLLQQNSLIVIQHGWFTVLIFAFCGVGLSVFLSVWRTNTQIAIALSLCLIWIALCLAFLSANRLLPILLPLKLIIMTTSATVLIERSRMNISLQQQVDQLWQQYQSDLVMRPSDSEKLKRSALSSIPSMQRVMQLATLAEQFGRSQSTQAAIARNLSIGLVAADAEGLVWFCNPIATDLLRVTVGSQLGEVLVPDWLSADQWQHTVTCFQQQSVFTKELAFQSRWYRIQFESLKDSKLQSNGILLLLEDVTAQKTIEANLDRQILELRRITQLKDDFLNTVSHELRTPLTNMRMAIELLKIIEAEAQREYYLKVLDSECDREVNLINELLDLQRLESGNHTLQLEEIDFRVVLPQLVEPFYRRTEPREQRLSLSIDPDLPICRSDRASLERIIAELINNACKYTPPHCEIRVAAKSTVDAFIELSVTNSGVEISEADQSRIFDRFYRVPRSDPWNQGGTGLGLALVKKLVESLNGEIEVTSQSASANILLNSTTFIVRLPIQSA